MGWSIYTHANTGDVRKPRALGTCDRCGFIYNRDRLRWQYDWSGLHEMNRGVLVCHKCMDTPQSQLKTINIPIDPLPITNPRPGEYIGMVISSNPDIYDTIVPNEIVLEYNFDADADVFQNNAFQADAFQMEEAPDQITGINPTLIGNRRPIVTQTTSYPLLQEITITPNPNPEFGDGGYTRGASTT